MKIKKIFLFFLPLLAFLIITNQAYEINASENLTTSDIDYTGKYRYATGNTNIKFVARDKYKVFYIIDNNNTINNGICDFSTSYQKNNYFYVNCDNFLLGKNGDFLHYTDITDIENVVSWNTLSKIKELYDEEEAKELSYNEGYKQGEIDTIYAINNKVAEVLEIENELTKEDIITGVPEFYAQAIIDEVKDKYYNDGVQKERQEAISYLNEKIDTLNETAQYYNFPYEIEHITISDTFQYSDFDTFFSTYSELGLLVGYNESANYIINDINEKLESNINLITTLEELSNFLENSYIGSEVKNFVDEEYGAGEVQGRLNERQNTIDFFNSYGKTAAAIYGGWDWSDITIESINNPSDYESILADTISVWATRYGYNQAYNSIVNSINNKLNKQLLSTKSVKETYINRTEIINNAGITINNYLTEQTDAIKTFVIQQLNLVFNTEINPYLNDNEKIIIEDYTYIIPTVSSYGEYMTFKAFTDNYNAIIIDINKELNTSYQTLGNDYISNINKIRDSTLASDLKELNTSSYNKGFSLAKSSYDTTNALSNMPLKMLGSIGSFIYPILTFEVFGFSIMSILVTFLAIAIIYFLIKFVF